MRNRVIGLLIGIAVAVVVITFLSPRSRIRGWNLLPENSGPLTAVALQYTRAAGPDVGPAYRAFLTAIDPSTQVIAVCGDRADAADFTAFLRTFPQSHPERVHVVVVGVPITPWCKDRFLASSLTAAPSPFQGEGWGEVTLLLTPTAAVTGLATRTNDARVAGAIATAFPDRYRTVGTGMHFDAGDVVATGNRLIVSDTLWKKNAGDRFNDPSAADAFDRTLAAEFNRKVIHLHGAPDHHIGMFAAPLDDHTVIVGDPNLAKPLWSSTLSGTLGTADFSATATAPFARAAAELQAAGFRVIRAPLVYFGPQEYLTYTNAVFETRGSRRIVYMPWYDAPALDAAGRAAYESAGWEVHPIPVRRLYRHRGTIGCLINVLQRG